MGFFLGDASQLNVVKPQNRVERLPGKRLSCSQLDENPERQRPNGPRHLLLLRTDDTDCTNYYDY